MEYSGVGLKEKEFTYLSGLHLYFKLIRFFFFFFFKG